MKYVYPLLCFLLASSLSSTDGFGAVPRRLIAPSRVAKQQRVSAAITKNVVAQIVPRGGSIVLVASARISAVAQLASVLGITHGIMYLFFTDRLEKIYGDVTEPGSQPRFVHKGIGAIALGQGLSLHMALIRKSSTMTAIGVALLPRLLLSYYLTLTGDKRSYVSNFLKTNTALMTWVVLTAFTGIGNPPVAAKVFTTFAIGKGLYLALAPVAASKRFFETDVSNKTVERVHFQALGEHLTYTAVYMAGLAYGLHPATAAGAAAAVWAGIIVGLRQQADSKNGEIGGRAYLGAATVAAIAVGFLWPAAAGISN